MIETDYTLTLFLTPYTLQYYDITSLCSAEAGMDLIEASGVPLAGLTVYQGFQPFVQQCALASTSANATAMDTTTRMAALRSANVNMHTAGMRVLIHGGSSAVGTLAIQYCKNVLGMHVITTVSPDEFDFVKNLGADEAIDNSNTTFEGVIQPVDVVFDTKSELYEARTLHSSVIRAGGWYLKCPVEYSLQSEQQRGSLQIFLPDMQLRPVALLTGLIREQWKKLSTYVQTLSLPSSFQLPFSGPRLDQQSSSVHVHCITPHPTDEDLQVAMIAPDR